MNITQGREGSECGGVGKGLRPEAPEVLEIWGKRGCIRSAAHMRVFSGASRLNLLQRGRLSSAIDLCSHCGVSLRVSIGSSSIGLCSLGNAIHHVKLSRLKC